MKLGFILVYLLYQFRIWPTDGATAHFSVYANKWSMREDQTERDVIHFLKCYKGEIYLENIYLRVMSSNASHILIRNFMFKLKNISKPFALQ